MEAVITKIGSTITSAENVIITLSINDGFTELFGIKKPKKKTFLMAMPSGQAGDLSVGQMDAINLTAFDQVDREWTDDTGKLVTNTWLHTKIN